MSNETMLKLLEEKESSYYEVLNNVESITKKVNQALQVNFESFINYVESFSEIVKRLNEFAKKCGISTNYECFEIGSFRVYFEGYSELKYCLSRVIVSKQDLLKSVKSLFEKESFIQAFSTIESTKEKKSVSVMQ